ncbi:MAG: dienelactone hydrolase family protein [Betaproteobacteria bacterium]|nr:dienelactone hydrolase family protein [Betaproteobacteria bacterium]
MGGAQLLAQRSVGATCISASAWNGARCAAFARRVTERAATPFVSGGDSVTLEVVVFEPLSPGPWPAVLFHHGSTGNGDDPTLFTQTFTSESVARHFTERGWLVAFPQRRGRGASGGIYDEGFTADRSRYSCLRDAALAGVEHALADANAALTHVQQRANVVSSRVIVAGQSRGGILAVAQAGTRPDAFVGVINFVGGWLGEGCQDAIPVNTTTFARGGGYNRPTLWLYGENDPFYSATHSRANFAAFQAAGGQGTFTLIQRAAGLSGHLLINDAALWAPSVSQYLNALP